jgi:hypothetical protein
MRFLVEWIRRAAEPRLRVPTSYITELGEASFSGFIKFVLFLPLAGHRGRTDGTLLHVARLVAFRHEDCRHPSQPCSTASIRSCRRRFLSSYVSRKGPSHGWLGI